MNGAPFEAVINRYTSLSFPTALDPMHPFVLQIPGEFNGSASRDNSSWSNSYSSQPQNLDDRNNSRNRLDLTAAPVGAS